MGCIHTRKESSGQKNLGFVPQQVEARDSLVEKEEAKGRSSDEKESAKRHFRRTHTKQVD